MSVRGLVTVVIGVVAFVVIDSLSKMGALLGNWQMNTPLNPGNLRPVMDMAILSYQTDIFKNESWASAETIHGAPQWGEERVHPYEKS